MIHWIKQLGYGLDGVVWRVEINGRVFAVKVVSGITEVYYLAYS